jgi:phosphatidate cytidylyltransferase
MSKKMMVKILTAVILIAVVVPPLYLGGIWVDILLWVIAALAGYEIAFVSDQKPHILRTILNMAAILAMYYVPRSHFGVIVAIWLSILFTMELADEKITTDMVVYPFTLTVLCGLAMKCLAGIYANEYGPLLMLYVGLACYLCDTFAYFCGVAFGKHKMIPRVSPNKTWEGSIGGYLAGSIISLLYGVLVLKKLPFGLLLAGSLLLPLAAQIGDLSFSSIKRRFKVKDFGNLLPGHGGVLDRIDSIIFCLMVFNALMILWGIAA